MLEEKLLFLIIQRFRRSHQSPQLQVDQVPQDRSLTKCLPCPDSRQDLFDAVEVEFSHGGEWPSEKWCLPRRHFAQVGIIADDHGAKFVNVQRADFVEFGRVKVDHLLDIQTDQIACFVLVKFGKRPVCLAW